MVFRERGIEELDVAEGRPGRGGIVLGGEIPQMPR